MRTALPAALLALLLPLVAAAAPGAQAPLWTRSLPAGPPDADVQIAIAGGTVALVRTGEAVVGLDLASGKKRWTLPNVVALGVTGEGIVVARAGAVFAVRPSDAAVRWTRPCAPAPFVVAWADRIATLCAGRITILRASDGAVVAARPLARAAAGRVYRAERINENYFALSNDVSLQTGFTVVDGHTGATCWRKANSQIVYTGPSWIDVTPAHSPSVWAAPGTLVRRALASGKLLAKHAYQFNVPVDEHGTPLYASTAAVYAYAGDGELYRSPLSGTQMQRITPEGGAVVGPTIVNGSVFYGTAATNDAPTATMKVERFANGAFVQRTLGTFDNAAGQRVGDRIALSRRGTVTIFDERGNAGSALRTGCPKIGGVVASAQRYVVLCPSKTASTILGFARS